MPGPEAAVNVQFAGLPSGVKTARVTHYRIDSTHGNCYEEWKRMGSPIAPNERQYARLEEASRLTTLGAPESVSVENGMAIVTFNLPRQAVSL